MRIQSQEQYQNKSLTHPCRPFCLGIPSASQDLHPLPNTFRVLNPLQLGLEVNWTKPTYKELVVQSKMRPGGRVVANSSDILCILLPCAHRIVAPQTETTAIDTRG